MSGDPVQDLFPSHLGDSQDPGLIVRNLETCAKGLAPCPACSKCFISGLALSMSLMQQAKSGLELWLLPEHGEFINRVNETDIRKGPGTLC